jgi:hypothetical protein
MIALTGDKYCCFFSSCDISSISPIFFIIASDDDDGDNGN